MDLIDTRTVFFFFGISSIIIILIYLSFIILNKTKNWCLITFISGKAFQTFGFFGLGLRFILPEFISSSLGIIFFFIGWAFEIFGIISFDLVFRRKNYYTLLIATIVFILFSIIFSGSPDYQRAILFSLAIIFYFGFGGIYFIQLSAVTRFRKLIGYTYIIFSMIFIIHIVSLIIQKENFQFLVSEGISSDIVNLLACFVILFGSIGLLFILKEQDELIIKNDNLELKIINTTKDKFFSIIAHDLRSPIGALTQLGEALLKHHNEIPEYEREKLIASIKHASLSTFNLLENLLQWARSESGYLRIHPVNLQMGEIIDNAIALLKENISKKSISLKKEYPDNLNAFGDYNMISTVIRNIISNAIKFVHEKGIITISSINNFKENIVKINISDNGVGIDPNRIKKLFDIDSDYKSRGTKNEIGSGLGLKLCKEFMIKNKGDITVSSEINKGSIFTIILPLNLKTATNSL